LNPPVGGEAAFGPGALLIQDRFLCPSVIRSLVDCARARRERGDFAPARIGADGNLQRREDIRGDAICWIAAPLFPAEQRLLDELEQWRLKLNHDALLGLFELELQFAWYPPGAGYERHVDQPRGRGQRTVSLALYLNEEWTSEAGGELRIFDADNSYRDIEPLAGRLVSFLTQDREHAVLPTLRDRLSISGWFRTRA
jgi:SM-20-related protein